MKVPHTVLTVLAVSLAAGCPEPGALEDETESSGLIADDGSLIAADDVQTGSHAEPATLMVEADGERIGYLMGVFGYGYIVWDDVNEVTFRVSQETGNVASDILAASDIIIGYNSSDCTGQPYVESEYAFGSNCEIAAPLRRNIIAWNGSPSGQTAAFPLMLTVGTPVAFQLNSYLDGSGYCSQGLAMMCAMPIEETTVIPKTFPLPITVSEVEALP